MLAERTAAIDAAQTVEIAGLQAHADTVEMPIQRRKNCQDTKLAYGSRTRPAWSPEGLWMSVPGMTFVMLLAIIVGWALPALSIPALAIGGALCALEVAC